MIESSRVFRPAPRVSRLLHGGMHIDFISTSEGLLRIGSMPDISKLTAHHGLDDALVAVPPWEVTQAGDNYTGEEFVFWRAQTFGHPGRRYIGRHSHVDCLRRKLDAVFPYFFDDHRLRIVRKDWLDKWFLPEPVEETYAHRDLKIRFTADNIEVWDKGDLLYNRRALAPDTHPDRSVATTLAGLDRESASTDNFTLTCIGSGNGFSGRSASLLARIGKQAMWIDPCAFPARSLADAGVHWDDITHILVTHNHEDHMSGITACLRRCAARKRQLTLITGKNIFRILTEQYQPLFPDIHRMIRFLELTPGIPLDVDGMRITPRLNHHILPYGTLGLKVSAGGKTVGISGDTKFCTAINRVLGRPELEPDWFRECDLVLHEIDFFNAHGVHSYWQEVATLRDQIPGRLYGYHSPEVVDPPIPLVRQGQTFRL
ncbi:MAG TPA: hypothetical protein DHV36_02240 [Desulfobacteraceae bacterium]|nr:hypothetical protein [Desulfobacteraceae bacterium]